MNFDQGGDAPAGSAIDARVGLDVSLLAEAAEVLAAAYASGLTAALLERSATAEEHAARLELHPTSTAIVLDVLTKLGIAQRDDGSYRASVALRGWNDSVPGGALAALALLHHVHEFLRTGEPLIRVGVDAEEREGYYRYVASQSGVMYDRAAAELAERTPGSPQRILDVGAGSGVWSLAMAQRHRDARVVGLDLSDAVLEAFEARGSELGLVDRIETLAGDVHELEISPESFDRVVVANVLRLEPRDRAADLLRRLRRALQPRGDLIVVDAIGGGTAERETARALYRLHLSLRSGRTTVYDRDEVEQLLRAAGLQPVKFIEIEAWPHTSAAIIATRPPRD